MDVAFQDARHVHISRNNPCLGTLHDLWARSGTGVTSFSGSVQESGTLVVGRLSLFVPTVPVSFQTIKPSSPLEMVCGQFLFSTFLSNSMVSIDSVVHKRARPNKAKSLNWIIEL